MVNIIKYSDHDLMKLVEKKSKISDKAFEAIYDRYSDKLYRYILFMTDDNEAANDICQDIFISLYEKLKNKKTIDNLNAFLYASARNQSFSYINKNKNKQAYVETIHRDIVKPNYGDDELFLLIINTVNELESKYKEAYILREFNGLSHKDIADILNISTEGVRTRVHRAQLKVKEKLNPIIKELNEI